MSRNPLRRVVSTFGGVVGVLALGALFVAPAFAAGADVGLSKTLKVSMKFTQDTYKVDDIARVTVTLTNSDSQVLKGVSAACNQGGFPNVLTGRVPGWAALNGGGVDLDPGQTKTVDVSEALPTGAFDYGYVTASCIFGPNAANGNIPPDFPSAYTTAKVPGATVDYSLMLEDNGRNPIANTKVYALDPDTKQIVGRAVTDAAGVLQFKGIPAGRYQLYVVGTWQQSDGNPIIVDIHRGSGTPGTTGLTLFPGPFQRDLEGGTTPPTTSATTTSAPSTSAPSTSAGGGAGGTVTPTSRAAATTTAPASTTTMTLPKRLPNTGANVFGPIVAGLALLAAGAGALLIARRRRATN